MCRVQWCVYGGVVLANGLNGDGCVGCVSCNDGVLVLSCMVVVLMVMMVCDGGVVGNIEHDVVWCNIVLVRAMLHVCVCT